MTFWTNAKIRTDDPEAVAEIAEAVVSGDPEPRIDQRESAVFICSIPDFDENVLLRRASQYASSAVVVDANDTADTAAGTAYDLENGVNRLRSRGCNPDERRDWHGISYDGLRVDGGKYY